MLIFFLQKYQNINYKCILFILICCINTLCAPNQESHRNFTRSKNKKPTLYYKVAWWNYSGDDMDTFRDIFKHVDRGSESFYDDLSVTILWILLAVLFSLCVLWVLGKCFKLVSLSKVDLWFWCDGWFDCCNKNKMENHNIGPVNFDMFKQNLKSFGFVCAVRMANLSRHHQQEVISRYKFCEIEKRDFFENYKKVNLQYAIEKSSTLNEMNQRVPELWYMLILGWTDSCHNSTTSENFTNKIDPNGSNNDLDENAKIENTHFEVDGFHGIPITEMQPEQMPIKKLNAFRLCIILDTFFRLRYETFKECELSKQAIINRKLISRKLMSRRHSDSIKVRSPSNICYNEGTSSLHETITKLNDSNGTSTTEIVEETSFSEHFSRANIEIKYVRNIPTDVQSIIFDIAKTGHLKFPKDDISCSFYIEKHLKAIECFECQLNQPIICVKKVAIMTLFDYEMDTFEEVNQLLYFTLFDRGCIVINDFNKQGKYLEKLLSMASRESLRKSMNFSWKGVTYVWKFLPMSANDSRISKDDMKRRHVPTLLVSYRG